MNEVSSQRSKDHVIDRPKKVGPLDRARSRCWVLVFHFCKVPRALLRKWMALWLRVLAPPGLRCNTTGFGNWQRWRKIGQNWCTLNGPVPHREDSPAHVIEFLGTLGCWVIHYLTSPFTLCSSLSFNWGFLRMPAVIFLISATIPTDSWGSRNSDGWIVTLLCSLSSLMYQGKYISD